MLFEAVLFLVKENSINNWKFLPVAFKKRVRAFGGGGEKLHVMFSFSGVRKLHVLPGGGTK